MFFQIVKRVNITDTKFLILYRLMRLAHVKPVLPVVQPPCIYGTVVQGQHHYRSAHALWHDIAVVKVQQSMRYVYPRIADNRFITLTGKLYSVRD